MDRCSDGRSGSLEPSRSDSLPPTVVTQVANPTLPGLRDYSPLLFIDHAAGL